MRGLGLHSAISRHQNCTCARLPLIQLSDAYERTFKEETTSLRRSWSCAGEKTPTKKKNKKAGAGAEAEATPMSTDAPATQKKKKAAAAAAEAAATPAAAQQAGEKKLKKKKKRVEDDE